MKALRVGFCGILGSGNLGNDGSLEAVVAYLREHHPDARLGFFCMGPETVAARYGAPATHLQWYEPHAGDATGLRAAGLKVLGKLLDPFRTLAWIRRYDVVIVPGMGVLEATLPLRPWGFPYSLFWLGVAARLTGRKVALVSVGSNVIGKRLTRWMITRAARLAHYRSFRDDNSREAMREMGVDVHADEVYPDLAFALPDPPESGPTGVVGVGLMAFYGGNDDRARAGEIHDAYLATMKRFVHWLVDQGRAVRLFIGDQADDPVLDEILSDVDSARYEPAATLPDLIRQMAAVDTVVATRYHNVLCALKAGKPTVSLGYAAKNDVIMDQMGLREFCQNARSIDFDRLVAQFTELEKRRDQFVDTMTERNRENVRLLDKQFAALSAAVLGGGRK